MSSTVWNYFYLRLNDSEGTSSEHSYYNYLAIKNYESVRDNKRKPFEHLGDRAKGSILHRNYKVHKWKTHPSVKTVLLQSPI